MADLCTLVEVKEFLQKDADETDFDDILTSLCARATKAIANFTGREFIKASPDNDQARTFWYGGGGSLDLSPYDLRTVTSVVIDTETSSPTTLVANTDYFLYPLPAKDGVYQWMEFNGFDTDSRRRLTITGKWGFDAVPDDVKHWAIVTVVEWFRKDSAAFSTALQLEAGFLERPELLPRAAVAGLMHYRRIGVG